MSDRPWCKFYPSDWLGGTVQLSAMEKLVYFTALMLIYDKGEPPAEDYPRLARACGAPVKTVKQAVESLVSGGCLLRTETGGLWNARAEKELFGNERGADIADKDSLSAKRRSAAAARWSKKADSNSPHAKADFAYAKNANGDAKSDANAMQTAPIRAGALPEARDHSQNNIIKNTNKKTDFAKADSEAESLSAPRASAASQASRGGEERSSDREEKDAASGAVGLPGASAPAEADADTPQAEFARDFWPLYPHKIGIAAAKAAFLKAREKAETAEMLAALRAYIKTKPEGIAWCNPATWLNQERWKDQPAPKPSAAGQPPRDLPYEQLLQPLRWKMKHKLLSEEDAIAELRLRYPHIAESAIRADLGEASAESKNNARG